MSAFPTRIQRELAEQENGHTSAAGLRRNFHRNFTACPAVHLVRPLPPGLHAHLRAVRIVPAGRPGVRIRKSCDHHRIVPGRRGPGRTQPHDFRILTARKLISGPGKAGCQNLFLRSAAVINSVRRTHIRSCAGSGTIPGRPGKLPCGFIRMAEHEADKCCSFSIKALCTDLVTRLPIRGSPR